MNTDNEVRGKNAVLIVDDDTALLKMGEELLSDEYEVSIAKSGEQALKLLSSGFMPDIVLLDINMPGMDGYQTLERMHDIEDMLDIPVVFLTGVADNAAEVRGLSMGAVDYVTKPFVREILLARIKVHLEGGQRRKQLRQQKKTAFDPMIDEDAYSKLASQLTDTEQKIARLLLLGYTNQEIGEELHYSYAYVKKVVATIFSKAGVNKRYELRRMFVKG